MGEVNKLLGKFKSENEQTFNAFRDALSSCFNNQKVIADSHDRLDVQQFVEMRLLVSKLNECAEAVNALGGPKKVDLLTVDDINETVGQFLSFRKIPNYAEHLPLWYTGGDITKLFTQHQESGAADSTPTGGEETTSDEPADAEIFGGDYVSTNRNAPEETESSGAEDQTKNPGTLSELRRSKNSSANNPEHNGEGTLVPAV